MLFVSLVAHAQIGVKVVNDTKTQAMVAANAGAAAGSEKLYNDQADSTLNKRTKLLSKVMVRYMMKTAEKAAKENIGDVAAQGGAYVSLCSEVVKLTEAVEEFIKTAAKHPVAAFDYRKKAGGILLEAEEMVKRTIAVSMNGKLPNPFKYDPQKLAEGDMEGTKTLEEEESGKDDKKKNKDGANLLLADERIELCNQTIFELRHLRRAVRIATFKIDTKFRWSDLLKENFKYEYCWAMYMEAELNNTKRMIDRAPWKR